MKFYYDGKLMRTSKTHEYHFAIINASGTCWSCHGTREAAEKEYRRIISEYETGIESANKAIAMINKGIYSYMVKSGRISYRVNLKTNYGDNIDRTKVEYWEARIESLKADIERFKTRKIVELEMRA